MRVAQGYVGTHENELVGEDQAVLEHPLVDQHRALALRGQGHGDARQRNHLAHHAGRGIHRRGQYGINPELIRGNHLQVAEQCVGRCVAAGQEYAEPPEDGAEEREDRSRCGEREAERGRHA